MLAYGLERVRIEESVSFEGYAGDESVVERALEHVIVLGLAVEEEHPVVYIYVSDGGAGLAICRHVRKLVVVAEGLAGVGGTDTSGDVHLLGNDVLPDAVDGVDVALVSGEGGYVSHT